MISETFVGKLRVGIRMSMWTVFSSLLASYPTDSLADCSTVTRVVNASTDILTCKGGCIQITVKRFQPQFCNAFCMYFI